MENAYLIKSVSLSLLFELVEKELSVLNALLVTPPRGLIPGGLVPTLRCKLVKSSKHIIVINVKE